MAATSQYLCVCGGGGGGGGFGLRRLGSHVHPLPWGNNLHNILHVVELEARIVGFG